MQSTLRRTATAASSTHRPTSQRTGQISSMLFGAGVAMTKRFLNGFFSPTSAASITNNYRILSPSLKIKVNIKSTFFEIALIIAA